MKLHKINLILFIIFLLVILSVALLSINQFTLTKRLNIIQTSVMNFEQMQIGVYKRVTLTVTPTATPASSLRAKLPASLLTPVKK